MSGATSIFGPRGDGVNSTTKAGFKKSGLNADGSYGDQPSPPVPPPPPLLSKNRRAKSDQPNSKP